MPFSRRTTMSRKNNTMSRRKQHMRRRKQHISGNEGEHTTLCRRNNKTIALPFLEKGRMGSALMGSLRISCFWQGLSGVLPLNYFYLPNVPGCTFFPNLSTFISFAAAPFVLTPFVRVRFRPVPELNGSVRFGSVRFLIPSCLWEPCNIWIPQVVGSAQYIIIIIIIISIMTYCYNNNNYYFCYYYCCYYCRDYYFCYYYYYCCYCYISGLRRSLDPSVGL